MALPNDEKVSTLVKLKRKDMPGGERHKRSQEAVKIAGGIENYQARQRLYYDELETIFFRLREKYEMDPSSGKFEEGYYNELKNKRDILKEKYGIA